MALVDIKDISKVFKSPKGDTLAIDHVSFSVEEREFLCIVGPSGCGKSTILRMIAGLEFPTSGQVLFQGQPVKGPSQEISMVFQNFALLPWKTARENVLLALEDKDMSRKEKENLASSMLKRIGLAGFEDEYPSGLSGGMKQRVGIARALAVAPELLVLDEPFSSLDEVTARELREQLLAVWRDRGLKPNTFIHVTHLVEEAVLLADRVIVMSPRPGRVVGEVKIEVPRPRLAQIRTQIFFDHVDRIEDILISKSQYGGHEEPFMVA